MLSAWMLYFYQTPDSANPSFLHNLGDKLQSAAILPDLANFTDFAYRALVFGLVFAAVESTDLEGAAPVDGGVGCGTDIKLSELIIFDLVDVTWITFACSFDLPCLEINWLEILKTRIGVCLPVLEPSHHHHLPKYD